MPDALHVDPNDDSRDSGRCDRMQRSVVGSMRRSHAVSLNGAVASTTRRGSASMGRIFTFIIAHANRVEGKADVTAIKDCVALDAHNDSRRLQSLLDPLLSLSELEIREMSASAVKQIGSLIKSTMGRSW